MAICSVCGKELPEDYLFCNQCGHKVIDVGEDVDRDTHTLSTVGRDDVGKMRAPAVVNGSAKRGRIRRVVRGMLLGLAGIVALAVILLAIACVDGRSSLVQHSKSNQPTIAQGNKGSQQSQVAVAPTATPTAVLAPDSSPVTFSSAPTNLPGLTGNSMFIALAPANVLSSDMVAGGPGGEYYDDIQTIGLMVLVGVFDSNNQIVTDPSEDGARMTAMVEPDSNSPIPLTQNQLEVVRDILVSAAETQYDGASPNQAGAWETQNFGATSSSPATTQIGPGYITTQDFTMSNVPYYRLDITCSN